MAPTTPDQQTTHPAGERRADVELRLPAQGAYAAVVRTTAAGLAARLDFTIDDIEDLRIAIGEATALTVPEAAPGTDLVCRFAFAPGELAVELDVVTGEAPTIDRESFAWQVLETMTEAASAAAEDGHLRIRFTVRSPVAEQMTGSDL